MSGITEAIVNFLRSITDNAELLTFFAAMIPLIELKGAIPVGVSLGLSIPLSSLFSYLGSTLVVLPVFFLLIPVFNLLKKIPFIKKAVEKTEAMLKRRAAALAEKSKGSAEDTARKILFWGLMIFVAVPLPVTGVWTGTAIAVFLNIKFKDSVLPLALGNMISGGIITLLISLIGANNANIVLNAVLILAVVMLIVTVIKIALSKPDASEDTEGKDCE